MRRPSRRTAAIREVSLAAGDNKVYYLTFKDQQSFASCERGLRGKVVDVRPTGAGRGLKAVAAPGRQQSLVLARAKFYGAKVQQAPVNTKSASFGPNGITDPAEAKAIVTTWLKKWPGISVKTVKPVPVFGNGVTIWPCVLDTPVGDKKLNVAIDTRGSVNDGIAPPRLLMWSQGEEFSMSRVPRQVTLAHGSGQRVRPKVGMVRMTARSLALAAFDKAAATRAVEAFLVKNYPGVDISAVKDDSTRGEGMILVQVNGGSGDMEVVTFRLSADGTKAFPSAKAKFVLGKLDRS